MAGVIVSIVGIDVVVTEVDIVVAVVEGVAIGGPTGREGHVSMILWTQAVNVVLVAKLSNE